MSLQLDKGCWPVCSVRCMGGQRRHTLRLATMRVSNHRGVGALGKSPQRPALIPSPQPPLTQATIMLIDMHLQ